MDLADQEFTERVRDSLELAGGRLRSGGEFVLPPAAPPRHRPNRRVMLVAAAAVVAAIASLLVFGHSNHDRRVVAPVTEPSTSASPIDPNDPRPLLTFSSWTYGPTDYWQPVDLPDIAVYPDGSVVRVVRQPSGFEGNQRLVEQKFSISPDELASLVRRAVEAGLVGGGLQPMVEMPAGQSVVDGGRMAFTFREGDQVTIRVVDQPGEATQDGGDREAFDRLASTYADLCCHPHAGQIDLPTDRWVVLEHQAGTPSETSPPWNGPDLSTLRFAEIGGYRCAIVSLADWPVTLAEQSLPELVFHDAVVTRRPLLPHESTCAQVVALRQMLDPAAAQRPNVP